MNKEHILKMYLKGLRYDGRKLLDYRPVIVESNISAMAEGSARVKIGETEVLAGVKLAIEEPYPDTPDQGKLAVNAELMALSNPEFEPGPPGDQAIELARVVDRGVRESKMIDMAKLCITAGEKVWAVMIDICTINDAGNLLDAAALASIVALKNTRFPKVDENGFVQYDVKTEKHLPLLKIPIEVTVLKVGDYFIVDPTTEEEKNIDARLTVALSDDNHICAMQKGGDVPLSIEEIGSMVDIAIKKIAELRKKLPS